MKRHRELLEVNSQINITNLLDTALTLLIGFMIVAPTLKSGIPVELPKVEHSETISENEDNSVRITIAVRDPESVEDKILVDGQRVRLKDLPDVLRERQAANPDLAITIDGDQNALFDTGVQVFAAANLVGIENFNISTDRQSAAPADDEDED